jgi:hypothetical protein
MLHAVQQREVLRLPKPKRGRFHSHIKFIVKALDVVGYATSLKEMS